VTQNEEARGYGRPPPLTATERALIGMSAIAGLGIWVIAAIVAPPGTPWDATFPYTPLMLSLGAACGYFIGRHLDLISAAIVAPQLIAIWFQGTSDKASDSLWGIGIPMVLVYGLAVYVCALGGDRLRKRRKRPESGTSDEAR
jgi:hypothetical protein